MGGRVEGVSISYSVKFIEATHLHLFLEYPFSVHLQQHLINASCKKEKKKHQMQCFRSSFSPPQEGKIITFAVTVLTIPYPLSLVSD